MTTALSFEPNNYEIITQIGLCFTNIGFKFELDYYFNRALMKYEKALKLSPQDSYIMLRKAIVLTELKRYNEVCEILVQLNVSQLRSGELISNNKIKDRLRTKNKFCKNKIAEEI